ncbi:hypothetical protein QA584_27290 [Anaerocolumna sp. AGMB13025]|uniref:hypothetical protein n=1 Tax=Anaerocolumna sp. AGMB13025 TaxID=3039116 RepID=UPI00242002F3|nr:hypothetical protein [Anaerocolumna sp. AGMB13025]WFR57267.1 hypothetical protein QA584_27290 [Anaerocolumna sp. AGMB13025]
MDEQRFYSLCLQGEVLQAIEYLKSEPDKNDELLLLEKQYTNRFLSKTEPTGITTEEPWIEEVMNCYYEYFRLVLTKNPPEPAETQLNMKLFKLLADQGVKDALTDLDKTEELLEIKFREKGYTFLGGVTPPFRGPYIWKTTCKKDFIVTLPVGEQKVTVYFLSDFLMLGWAFYATFGKRHTGGWANEEGLFYVNNTAKPVDTQSEEFQVWFLKHEAQHLNDYINYPNLNARNLEYRAKLVELIYNTKPLDLLYKFKYQAKKDKTLPHAYAAYVIVEQIEEKLFGRTTPGTKPIAIETYKDTAPNLIQVTANRLLLDNNKRLTEAGIATEGIL